MIMGIDQNQDSDIILFVYIALIVLLELGAVIVRAFLSSCVYRVS